MSVLLLTALLVLCGCSGKDAQKTPLTASQLRGQRLYEASCARCHRADSREPLNGPGLKGMYSRKYLDNGLPANDERVSEILRRGRRTMPGFGELYNDAQMNDLIAYLHSL